MLPGSSELRPPTQEGRAHLNCSCYDAVWIPNPQNSEKTKFCLIPPSLGVIYEVAIDSWKKIIFYQCKNLILHTHDALWSGREEKPYSWSYRGTSGSGTQFSAAGAFLPASWETQDSLSLLHFDVTLSLCGVSISHWHKGEMKWEEKNSIHYCSRAKNKTNLKSLSSRFFWV